MSSVPSRAGGVFTLCLLVALASASARAQPPVPGPPGQSQAADHSWSGRAGVEWFSLRDVARVGPPVDGSPVAWVGRGPTIEIRFDRERPKRLVRAEVTLASIGHFSYDTGVAASPRPAGDHAFRLDGRYEYRWYPFRNILMRGLDFGGGLQGVAGYVSLNRHLPPSITFGQREARLGGTVVAALRFHHWQRFKLEASYANGGMVAWTVQHHSAGADATMSSWGGGWLTDLAVVATARIAGRTALVMSYLESGEGHLGMHRGYAASRGHLMLGLTYVR